jgi:hypothetical protein
MVWIMAVDKALILPSWPDLYVLTYIFIYIHTNWGAANIRENYVRMSCLVGFFILSRVYGSVNNNNNAFFVGSSDLLTPCTINYNSSQSIFSWILLLDCRGLVPFSFSPYDLLLSLSQSCFTTGGLPPISSSWRLAPWDPRPGILFSDWTLALIVPM